MGAEVIAIEPPARRRAGACRRSRTPTGGARADYVDGALSVPFLKRARGKRSVALDITRPEGQELVRRLARARPTCSSRTRGRARCTSSASATTSCGAASAPRDCAISGYGQADEERPAMDVIVQAVSGAMAKTGFADGPPLRSGITIADHTTATFAALGIVAALRQRDLTGAGQLVDVAMLDVLTALVLDEPVDHYAAIGMPVRTGNADARGAPINTYRCADGWVAVTCTSDGQFERLCALDGATGTARSASPTYARAGAARASSTPRSKRGPRPDPARGRGGARRYRVPGRPGARSGRGRGRPGRTEPRAARGAPAPGRAGRSPERLPRRAPPDRLRRAASDLPPAERSARAPTPCCATSPAATTTSSSACANRSDRVIQAQAVGPDVRAATR